METSELADKLRALQSLVQRKGIDEEAFDLWNQIKSELGPKHRYELIVAWSRAVSSVNNDQFEYTAAKVISELKEESE